MHFNLPEKSSYIFNNTTKFWVYYSLQKSVKNDQTWSDFVPVDETDKPNLSFYDGFLRRKFTVSLYQSDIFVNLNQNFENVSSSLESYFFAHMERSQKELVFSGNEGDSSESCFLRNSDYEMTNPKYANYLNHLFASLPTLGSFNPFLTAPFSSHMSEDGRALRNFILPQFGDKETSIRVGIKRGDQSCFWQKTATDSIRYRFKINSVKLFIKRIRWQYHGYNFDIQKLHKPCTKDYLLLPSFPHESSIENCSEGATIWQKTFYDIYIPSYILIFKVNPSFIGGSSEEYSTKDIKTWMDLQVKNLSIHADSLSVFDEKFNIFQNDIFAKFFNFSKQRRDFCNGFKFNPKISMELLSSVDYHYPSLLLDFNLENYCAQKINPVLAQHSLMEKKVKLDIRLDFETDQESVSKGTFVFCSIYSDEFLHLTLGNGNIINPMIMRNCK